MRNFVILLLFSVITSCIEDDCRKSDIPNTAVKINVDRLEEQLFQADDTTDILKIFKDNTVFANGFLDADQYPSEDRIAGQYLQLLKDPYIDSLYQETIKEYGDFDEITDQLSIAFGKIKSLYPEFEVPKIQTTVTGLYKDLYFNDTTIIIGIDHFLGQNAKYKPLDVPDYIYRRYDKDHMAAMIVSVLAGGFNKSDFLDNTMLAEMIDFGKIYYFTAQVLPCTPEHLIIGYTVEEWLDSKKHDGIIWANFIENELLYETNHTLKNKFIGERPRVYEIGDRCPGRIGRWVGWQIVEAYMKSNPQVTLTQLMQETDARKIFQGSKYKPRN